MKIGLSLSVAAALMTAAVATWTQTAPAGEAHERERIAAGEREVDARFSAQRQVCLERFATASCVGEAKRERREALSVLENDRHRLDDRLRQERAAARLESIRRRTEEARQRDDRRAAPVPRPAQRTHLESTPSAIERSLTNKSKPRAERAPVQKSEPQSPPRAASVTAAPVTEDPALRLEREARKREAFESAQRAASAHRAEVEKRNAERAAHRKPIAPLPLPPGASSP